MHNYHVYKKCKSVPSVEPDTIGLKFNIRLKIK